MQEEIWKAIPGYEGIYEVSDLGRVKSLGNNKTRKEKILKFSNNRKGYYKLNLFKNANTKTYEIHQLVAMAFLNHIPSKSKKVIDHINNVKTDNRLENLQYLCPNCHSQTDTFKGRNKKNSARSRYQRKYRDNLRG